MPGFDRTGPLGAGPRTGWGRGYCSTGVGAGAGGARGVLRGLGRGGAPWGGGRGRCFGGRGWWGRPAVAFDQPPTSSDSELERLKEELAKAQKAVQEMEARLAELEKPA
ncbi:MAG: DUF5320 domain-containing protein [Desulfomonilaceae bacterium]